MEKKTKEESKAIKNTDKTPIKVSSKAGKLPKKKNSSESKTYGKSGSVGG